MVRTSDFRIQQRSKPQPLKRESFFLSYADYLQNCKTFYEIWHDLKIFLLLICFVWFKNNPNSYFYSETLDSR